MAVIKTVRTRQPAGSAQIDRGNPLARGLAYARKGGDLDTARRTGTRRIPRIDAVMDGFGATFGVGTTDGILLPYGGQATLRTYLAVVVWNGTGGSGGRIFDKHSNGSAGFPEAFFTSNTTVTYSRNHTTQPGQWTGAIPVNLTNAEAVPIVVTYDSSSTANDPKMYVRGQSVSVSETTAPVGTPVVSTAEYGLGNRLADSIRNFDGLIGCFFIWDRILSDDEIAQVSRNPWQLFAPERRLWVPHVDAGAPSQTLTAARYDNGNEFYASTINIGTVTLSSLLFSNNNIFYAASLSQSAAIYRPTSDIAVTGWTATPGGSIFDTINEVVASDVDYATSPDVSTPATFGTSAGSAGNFDIRIRAAKTATTGQLRVRLLNNLGVDVGGTAWQSLTTTPTTYTLSATASAAFEQIKIELQA